jgi:hypothetical protein
MCTQQELTGRIGADMDRTRVLGTRLAVGRQFAADRIDAISADMIAIPLQAWPAIAGGQVEITSRRMRSCVLDMRRNAYRLATLKRSQVGVYFVANDFIVDCAVKNGFFAHVGLVRLCRMPWTLNLLPTG